MYRWINSTLDHFNKKSPVLIETPLIPNIGNCAEEMYFGLLKAKREGKKVQFLSLQSPLFWKFAMPISNRELLRVESEYIIPNDNWHGWLGGILLTLVYSLMRVMHVVWRSVKLRRALRIVWPPLQVVAPINANYFMPSIGRSTLWQPDGIDYFSWNVVEELGWRAQFEQYQLPRLKADKHRRGQRIRVEMGIPLADWFVCLHVRESGFLNDQAIYRNGSIKNYIKAIKLITEAGGWVVRFGDSSMTPLPPLERVIDYPHTRFKSALMDMYLISQCRFFFGTNSGPSDVATLFGKQMILVNVTEWAMAYPVNKGDVEIVKHVFSRARNRFLSIQELLREPFRWQLLGPRCDEYVMVENTPEEISDVVEEFLAKPDPYEYSELQKSFNEGRRQQIHRWLDQGEPQQRGDSGKEHVTEQYRSASRCDAAAGTLGRKYLDENWLVDSLADEYIKAVTA